MNVALGFGIKLQGIEHRAPPRSWSKVENGNHEVSWMRRGVDAISHDIELV